MSSAAVLFLRKQDERGDGADEGNIIPVEVKSGHTGRLRSLHLFMDRAPHQMAVRLYAGNLKKEAVRTLAGKGYTLLSLPYYLAGKIEDYLQWAFSGETGTIS